MVWSLRKTIYLQMFWRSLWSKRFYRELLNCLWCLWLLDKRFLSWYGLSRKHCFVWLKEATFFLQMVHLDWALGQNRAFCSSTVRMIVTGQPEFSFCFIPKLTTTNEMYFTEFVFVQYYKPNPPLQNFVTMLNCVLFWMVMDDKFYPSFQHNFHFLEQLCL